MMYLEVILLCIGAAFSENWTPAEEKICQYVSCRIEATDKIIEQNLNPLNSTITIDEWYSLNEKLIVNICGEQPFLPPKWSF